MAQTRFHNFKRPIISLDENARISSLLPPGTYGGFDTLTPVSGNQVNISHEATGLKRTNLNGTETPKLGCIVSKQGVVVYEDEPIPVNVDFNPDGTWRTDLLIMTHIFIDSEGGAPASYSVLKNWDGVTLTPYMIPIGRIYVAPVSNNHTGTRYERVSQRMPGGRYAFEKDSENDVPWFAKPFNGNFTTHLNDFNQMTKSGIFYIETSTNRPTASTTGWLCLVIRRATYITQLAQAHNSGKAYTRSSADSGANWTPWQNLNNVDVPAVDLSAINAAIGSRNYTEDNFVTDGQSLTASIDIVDQVLEDHDNSIGAILTNISNILTMIGDLNYSSNNIVTDGTSTTTAIGALDASIGNRNYTDGKILTDGETITASLEKLNNATPKIKLLGSILSLAVGGGSPTIDPSQLPGVTVGFWADCEWGGAAYPNQGQLIYRNNADVFSHPILSQTQGHRHTDAGGGFLNTMNTPFRHGWFCPLGPGQIGTFSMGHLNGGGVTCTVRVLYYI